MASRQAARHLGLTVELVGVREWALSPVCLVGLWSPLHCWVTCRCWPPSWGGHGACDSQAVAPEQQVLLIQTTLLTRLLQCFGMRSLQGCSKEPYASGFSLFLGFSESNVETRGRNQVCPRTMFPTWEVLQRDL